MVARSHFGLSGRSQRGKNSVHVPFLFCLHFLAGAFCSVAPHCFCVYGDVVSCVVRKAVSVTLILSYRCVEFVHEPGRMLFVASSRSWTWILHVIIVISWMFFVYFLRALIVMKPGYGQVDSIDYYETLWSVTLKLLDLLGSKKSNFTFRCTYLDGREPP